MALHARASIADEADTDQILDNHVVPFGYRISWLANFYRGPIYKRIQQEHGLTSPEFLVLFCLVHQPGLNAQDICMKTGRARNSISRAVINLMDKGRVARETDAADRRRGILRITAEGRRLYARIVPLFAERQDAMLSVLSPTELALFDRLLNKLVHRSDGWANVY